VIELAGTPFDLASFRRVWERFGGSWDPCRSDDFGFTVAVGEGHPLWVDPLGQRILSVRLPTCYLARWEVDDPAACADRPDFDAAWSRLADDIRSILGPPTHERRDQDAVAYRAAIWQCEHGLLIAQQAAIDSEFGDEVCLLAEDLKLDELAAGENLARWLSARHQRLHEIHGFPALSERPPPP
jgi:hypothetical protein